MQGINFKELNFFDEWYIDKSDIDTAKELLSDLEQRGWKFGEDIDNSDSFTNTGSYNLERGAEIFCIISIESEYLSIHFKQLGDLYPGATVECLQMISKLFTMAYNYSLYLKVESKVYHDFIPKFGMGLGCCGIDDSWTPEQQSEYDNAVLKEYLSRKKSV